VLLHELGHIVDWLGRDKQAINSNTIEKYSVNSEYDADIWATRIVVKKGNRYYLPQLQFRSIFWLFEYWHYILHLKREVLQLSPSPRDRWDRIASEINGYVDLTSLYIKETRALVDNMVKSR